MDQEQKIEKARDILISISSKEETYFKKYDRARKPENREKWWDLYKKYQPWSYRAQDLFFNRQWSKKFAQPHAIPETPEEWIERRDKRKAKLREKFETTYRVQLHFMSESLGADYGTYHCERCKSKFHHSPSTLFRGPIKIHEITCGNCVNSLFTRNGQEAIFY